MNTTFYNSTYLCWGRGGEESERCVERERCLSYLCCVCGHFVRVLRELGLFRRLQQYYLSPACVKRVSSAAACTQPNENALPSLAESQQTNGKAADRVTHGSVRAPYDTRRVYYQVPARWIASCYLLVSLGR